jgi:hypothetical protein
MACDNEGNRAKACHNHDKRWHDDGGHAATSLTQVGTAIGQNSLSLFDRATCSALFSNFCVATHSPACIKVVVQCTSYNFVTKTLLKHPLISHNSISKFI